MSNMYDICLSYPQCHGCAIFFCTAATLLSSNDFNSLDRTSASNLYSANSKNLASIQFISKHPIYVEVTADQRRYCAHGSVDKLYVLSG
eukprot:scaffold521842_cov15-Prasinocladus_malaysianus.AAC.1